MKSSGNTISQTSSNASATANLRSKNFKEAADRFKSASEAFKQIAEAETKSDDALRDLGRILYSQGLAAAKQGDAAGAAKFFRESLETRRKREIGFFASAI